MARAPKLSHHKRDQIKALSMVGYTIVANNTIIINEIRRTCDIGFRIYGVEDSEQESKY
uniref:DUF4258 domain-containing protein n=1 Tax=Heterorhabditis bacteriophora TaxID=37862 RepID=A0A1I7X758_HETBA